MGDVQKCQRLISRRRGLRPDLPCGAPARGSVAGVTVCGRCLALLRKRGALEVAAMIADREKVTKTTQEKK